MAARTVALPRRSRPDLAVQCLTWADLGCPREIGLYDVAGVPIRVRRIHIIVAEDNPDALFTVVTFRPPLGPPEHMLGHRIA